MYYAVARLSQRIQTAEKFAMIHRHFPVAQTVYEDVIPMLALLFCWAAGGGDVTRNATRGGTLTGRAFRTNVQTLKTVAKKIDHIFMQIIKKFDEEEKT